MKNVRPEQLKTAIFLENENFDTILNRIFGADENGDQIETEYSLDGVWIGYPDSELSNEELLAGLAQYFDVSAVTSIHIDDCDFPIGVWIIYKE